MESWLEKYDILIAFTYNAKEDNFGISLYSEKYHVGEIAKKYGGGGHSGAAGFVFNDEFSKLKDLILK